MTRHGYSRLLLSTLIDCKTLIHVYSDPLICISFYAYICEFEPDFEYILHYDEVVYDMRIISNIVSP